MLVGMYRIILSNDQRDELRERTRQAGLGKRQDSESVVVERPSVGYPSSFIEV